MARTISDIQEEMLAAKEVIPELAALNSISRTAIWRLIVYIVAVAIWSLEKLLDLHKLEVTDIINNQKPGSPLWYVNMAQAYQHGQQLPPDSDKYDNTGLTEDEIGSRRVVKEAAVDEAERGIRMKVATSNGTDLVRLSVDQMAGFTEYVKRWKYAGVKVLITTADADSLKLSLEIYYDPLVLDSEGRRLDGSNNTPVQQAIAGYLQNVSFNGLFVLAYLVDMLQQVPGVVVPHILAASSRYGTLPYTPFSVQYKPDSGYLRLLEPADLSIVWIPKSAI